MKRASPVKKNRMDIGAELEKQAQMKAAAFSKSQQEILKQMKEANEEALNKKLTTSLKKAFNTVVDGEGNTILDEVAAKAAATYKNKDSVSMQDVINLQNALGETKNNIDLNVKGEMTMKEILKEIADEEEF